MKFTIKNSKQCKGRDGIAWSATLYIDGTKACDARNSGDGGMTDIYWYDKKLENQFGEYVNSLPVDMTADKRIYPNGSKQNIEGVICELVDDYEINRKTRAQIKKWCKTKTVYTLKNDKLGEYRTVLSIFTPAVKTYLTDKYGSTLDKIYNEDINS